MWEGVAAAKADVILGLTEAYMKDENPNKVNLGVGVYKDDEGRTPVLQCVKNAEKMLLETETSKSYLPISGQPVYAHCVQKLLFGPESEVIATGRASTVHAPGGTGALRVAAELLKVFASGAKVWVSSPTWANHRGIFAAAGFVLKDYGYYDKETMSLDFAAFTASLSEVSSGDIVVLHTCCHNPSGVDLSHKQWQEVAAIAKQGGWIPLLDFAYQGFGASVEEDRYAIEQFAATGIDFLVASSFSKNFGLYNERVGALTVVSPDAAKAAVAMSHLKSTVRVLYSNPPAHGGLVVTTILGDEALTAQWLKELAMMRQRIVAMRQSLVDGLAARGVQRDFSFIKEQRGMFSFSGLDDDTVRWLREEKSMYIVAGGRINLAGLTTKNIDYVCDAIAEALQK